MPDDVEPNDLGQVFCEVLAEAVAAGRSRSTLPKGALSIRVSASGGGSWTLLFEATTTDLLDGEWLPPGVPHASLELTDEGLHALGGRGGDVAALVASGALKVSGDRAVLAELAVAFKPGGSPLGVRMQTLKGRR